MRWVCVRWRWVMRWVVRRALRVFVEDLGVGVGRGGIEMFARSRDRKRR